MRSLSGPELIIILVVVVLLFGAPKLPGLAKSVAESLRIFKKEVKNKDEEKTEEKPSDDGDDKTAKK